MYGIPSLGERSGRVSIWLSKGISKIQEQGHKVSLSLGCLEGSGLPTDLCFGNQTSGTKPARTHLASHTYCWGTQKELQEGTSIGMEVYGGNDDSRVRTKQLTFLWKALSGPTMRWWFETLALYKARK